MSDQTRDHLDTFWELIDEILNAVLFVLIGLEFLAVRLDGGYIVTALSAILVVLLARFVSVVLLVNGMRIKRRFSKGVLEILTWGGLRGGISIALALSLPFVPERQFLLAATYVVVIFSVLVQGLTVGKVIALRSAPSSRSRSV
jgi:CPA1 family monovalent cation:H+ antiporter